MVKIAKDRPTPKQQLFVGTVISLSWQMLILVLIPAIGGHFLDQKTGQTPLFTIIGFIVAIALAALVTYRAYRILMADTTNKDTNV